MIYKGPSIYKFGGGSGGGGYNDGGQLVDGDLIKIENNTISSYDNLSRDPVNFYLDLKDGEIANAVVELTTVVNSTINVYVVKNGFYYLLGNVGGNTVTSGEDYNINIVGDSFSIEKINVSNNIEYVDLGGSYGVFPCVKVNSLLWLCQSLALYKRTDDAKTIVQNLGGGWRLPTVLDFQSLQDFFGGVGVAYNKLKSTSGWYAGMNGTNESRFNLQPNGYLTTADTIIGTEQTGYIMVEYTGSTRAEGLQYDGTQFTTTTSNIGADVRAVFDL